MDKTITQKMAQYLETVYRLQEEKGAARTKDIAAELDVHKSTVTAALRSLSEHDLLLYEPYEAANLTDEGRAMGERLYARHAVLSRFLSEVLDVDEPLADSNARRIEHAMDEEVLKRIVCFLAFVKRHPRVQTGWLERFRCFAEERVGQKSCQEWIRQLLEEWEDEQLENI